MVWVTHSSSNAAGCLQKCNVWISFVWLCVLLLGALVIATDRCTVPALCLSAPLSTDPCAGIYEAQRLIHSQIMWAGHSWTALLSIFPTWKRRGAYHHSTTVNAWFCQAHKSPEQSGSGSVRTSCWASSWHQSSRWDVLPACNCSVTCLSADDAARRAARAKQLV